MSEVGCMAHRQKMLHTPALEESTDWVLLSSFCDDSNLGTSVFK